MKSDEKKCPQCAEAIKKAAAVCKHCGYRFSDEEIAAQWKKEKDDKRNGLIGCGVLFVVVALVLAMCSGGEGSGDKAAKKAAAANPEIAKADFKLNYSTMLSMVDACDKANTAAGNAAGAVASGSMTRVDAYSIGKDAHEKCDSTWQELGKIKVPVSIQGDARKSLKDAIDTCSTAYFVRDQALQIYLEVMDGDMRPSKVSSYQEKAQAAQAGTLSCVAGYMDAGMKLGVDPKDLGSSK